MEERFSDAGLHDAERKAPTDGDASNLYLEKEDQKAEIPFLKILMRWNLWHENHDIANFMNIDGKKQLLIWGYKR